jgi:mono/diheme cytochrome c family protein
MKATRTFYAAAFMAAFLPIAGFVAGAQGKSTKDGVYTDAQADEGAGVYKDKCGGCHGDDLSGGGFAPALKTDSFVGGWADKKLDELFKKIKETMPADSPGTLSDAVTANLLAHMLKANGFPAGQTALATDTAALAEITFAKP